MYNIYDMNWNEKDEDQVFNTESEAISWVLECLPSDDYAYIVADEDDNMNMCIVFQDRVWRPQ